MSAPTSVSARPRRPRTVADMIRSLVVVLGVVALVLLVAPGRFGDPTPERDYSTEVAAARRAAPYEVLAPVGLPSGWETTSARYRTADDGSVHWHMGFDSPSGYAGLEQSDGRPAEFLAGQAPGARAAGVTRINGDSWRRLVGGRTASHALVRVADGVTTLVAGDATWPDTRRLAAALRAG